MPKSPLRNWLKTRKKTDPERPYEPPMWLGNHSNGEQFHVATQKERLMRELILKEGAELARRYGMERREFMASGLGMTLAMSVVNLANGCSSDGRHGGMNPRAGMGAGPAGGEQNPSAAGTGEQAAPGTAAGAASSSMSPMSSAPSAGSGGSGSGGAPSMGNAGSAGNGLDAGTTAQPAAG